MKTTMKKISLTLASGLLAASLVTPAWADEGYGDHEMDAGKMEKMGMMKQQMMGQHKMTGAVANIDYAKGTLSLKGKASEMTLHFPPDSIKDIKNGDTITVDLGFTTGDRAKKME